LGSLPQGLQIPRENAHRFRLKKRSDSA